MVLSRRWLYSCGILLALFIALFLSGCGSDTKLEQGYYKEIVVKANGELIGKHKLSEKEAKKAGLTYYVTMDETNKDQVKKVTSVYNCDITSNRTWNIEGELWDSQFASLVITPQDNGFMKYEFLDAGGQGKEGFWGAYTIRYRIDPESKRATVAYLYDKSGNNKVISMGNYLCAAQMQFGYDKENRLIKITPADESGNQVRAELIGGKGLSSVHIGYDEKKKDRIQSISWVNAGGNLVMGDNWAKEEFSYDDKGRVIAKSYFRENGRPKETGISGTVYASDVLSTRSLANTLTGIKECLVSGGAVTKYTYEGDNWYPSKISCFGIGGQSFGDQSEIRLEYDPFGNVNRYSVYGADGLPRKFMEGENITGLGLEYDDWGQISREIFYQGENKTAIHKWNGAYCRSVAEIQFTYDERGRVTSESYFDANGVPNGIYFADFGVNKTIHKIFIDYDTREIVCYSVNGDEIHRERMWYKYSHYMIGEFGNGISKTA